VTSSDESGNNVIIYIKKEKIASFLFLSSFFFEVLLCSFLNYLGTFLKSTR